MLTSELNSYSTRAQEPPDDLRSDKPNSIGHENPCRSALRCPVARGARPTDLGPGRSQPSANLAHVPNPHLGSDVLAHRDRV